MYFVDHRKKSVWIVNYKVASQSLTAAFASYLWRCENPEEFTAYTWLMFTRHPFDRLRSWWTAETPAKEEGRSFASYVDELLSSGFPDDAHLQPQCARTRIKFPDILLPYETLELSYVIARGHISWPRVLEHRNASPVSITWQELFERELTPAQVEGLRRFYAEDFRRLGYE